MNILLVLLSFLLLTPLTSQAQELNCADPITQLDMNLCAHQAWQYADEDLNLAYQLAVSHAKQIDQAQKDWPLPRKAGSAEMQALSTEEALRTAQRAWITFRDHACLAESDIAYGGSMQPLLYWSCAEALTRQRTEQLRFFGEMN